MKKRIILVLSAMVIFIAGTAVVVMGNKQPTFEDPDYFEKTYEGIKKEKPVIVYEKYVDFYEEYTKKATTDKQKKDIEKIKNDDIYGGMSLWLWENFLRIKNVYL